MAALGAGPPPELMGVLYGAWEALTVAAGLATLGALDAKLYDKLEDMAGRLEEGIKANLSQLSLGYQYQRVGSMACLFFNDKPVTNYTQASSSDIERFAVYFGAMLEQGIYLPPSQFEAFFISAAHTPEDIDKTIKANLQALQEAK